MKILIALVLTAVIVAACGDIVEDGVGAGPAANPDGDWELVSGVPLVAEFPITMSVEGNQVGGRAACNSYRGSVEFDGDKVTFGEFAWTEMGCEPTVMESEAAFLTALMSTTSFQLAGDRLTLSGPDGDLEFRPVVPTPTADLVDTTWVLETVIEGETASSVAGEPATLLLSGDGSLSASTGCRTLTGEWLDNGGVIIVPVLSADGECPEELSRQDNQVVTVIGDEFRVVIDGDQLTLTSMGGDGLVYRTAG